MISIVIVTWNSLSYLKDCLDSIDSLNLDVEIIIVDSHSSDGIKEYMKSKSLKFLYQEKRTTWSDANQIGLDQCHGEWVCLSNPDITFNPDFIKMIKDCEERNILVCAPQLIHPDGRLQIPSKIFTPWRSLYAHTRIIKLLVKALRLNVPTYIFPYDHDSSEAVPVDCPQGSLFVVNRKVLESLNGKLWHEGYLNGVSDIDAYRNFKRLGFTMWLFPQYRIIHHGSHITKRYPDWIEKDQSYGLILYFKYQNMSNRISPGLFSILYCIDPIVAVGIDCVAKIIRRKNPFFNPRHSAWVAGQRWIGVGMGWKYKIR